MPEPKRILIIGAGLAGASAAAALRENGFDGAVTVLGAEAHPPYELPPLSKKILLGEADEPDWVRDAGFWREHDVDLRSGTSASRIELGSKAVLDARGERHEYDRLLLATGSHPRTLPVPGVDLPGVYTLRTLDDALALRSAFSGSPRVVVIGTGWIGTEAAAAARHHGADVTMADLLPGPLWALGPEISRVFADLHTEHGVRWKLGSGIERVTGGPGGVTGVRLADGTELPADVVLVAVGAAPRVGLAHAAGLELSDEGGVAVDAALRTSAPDVYAAGDIAAQFHPRYGRRVRVEHWANAKNQGTHVAANLAGGHEQYTRRPYFFTDQYDLGCEYRGLADPGSDELVVRGDLAKREFTAFWLREGRVMAAMNVNMWDDGDALQALVDGDAQVTPQQLREGDLASLG
ncbi:NAD(P)/FAD-dependent oxidoreductase [Amycolatopsis thermophila]|uniref:NADPH-dependent 2,4-dienoyl-CoA reductase/sulfur reductase-like enzyme n=1 Tax=Amycolatopsis thermophila TaxID=206084 RepID=A0ABU0EWH8_9PSEU|nr:FAD-dependent oxidoreductase [Amycolatopsis thermophila]MDQ0379665.1 NADPH-dependent 2,4-dienoyl-CoA reductase/sulfur reductase-like enzyme [Amycolatopsis thermophila]